jgi:hypothetical protein
MSAEEELKRLQELITKSNLIEVDATAVKYDKCGKPVIVKDGTMLVPADYLEKESEKTKTLANMAQQAKHISDLERLCYKTHLLEKMVAVFWEHETDYDMIMRMMNQVGIEHKDVVKAAESGKKRNAYVAS